MNKPIFHRPQLVATAVILLLVALSVGAMLFRRHASIDAMTALVSVDGAELLSIRLSENAEPYEISLGELSDINVTLEVRDHAIRVLRSDCPDQICVRSGWLAKDMDIAICMPNRVSVVVASATEAGALRTGG